MESIEIIYRTDKKAHYGGEIRQKLVTRNDKGVPIIRFAEPLNEDSIQLNPIELEIVGMSEVQKNDFLKDFIPRLYDPKVCYQHQWKTGQFVLANNHILLHGRNSLKNNSKRKLQRIHII